MLAQYGPQRRVQEMSRGMIAHRRLAQFAVHARNDSGAFLQRNVERHTVNHRVGRRLVGVFHSADALAGFRIEQNALVADLTARFSVKGSTIEHEFRAAVSLDDAQYLHRRIERIAADELRRGQ
jgi:hypothetical protein